MLQISKQSKSGYARIAQAEEEEEEEDDTSYHDDPNHDPYTSQRTISGTVANSEYAPLQPGRRPLMGEYKASYTTPSQKRRRRNRSSSAVDVKAINARLEKWADEIAQKFKLKKIKGKSHDEEKLEIHHSVFVPPDGITPASADNLTARFTEQPEDRMTKIQYDDVVESVKVAIELGVHPKMITQGSSGSYFARNSQGKTVGVFKPKDEEPYATRNPKWTKWIHRNLFPFAFGRACLIPNLSYVSEAAAYLLDTRLQTNIVPYTDIVYLSSISFNHDYWDRRAYYRKKKQLPPKVGSFQVFLKGFQDANIFLKKHPWPDQQTSTLRAPSSAKGKRKKRWVDNWRPGRAETEDEEEDSSVPGTSETQKRKVFWSDALQLSFREQLEKLVILDYIMRNTDRGLDNWMVRIDEATQTASLVASPPKLRKDNDNASLPPEGDEVMNSGSATPEPDPTVSLGAIDNSLSWPWKHPDAWRSFPFGWLFLPVSLIGQPFTATTRSHFLPLLTSKQWWSDTQISLRKCFEQDSDFKERMFARQIAVMKGQAWNVVETLKTEGHGPLELTRRARVCVWDDIVEVPIVFPMRESSEDMRRQAAAPQPDAMPERDSARSDDESDIAGAYTATNPASTTKTGTSAPTHHLTNLPISPDAEIPSSKRFNLSRQGSPEDISLSSEHHDSTSTPQTPRSKAAEHLTITLQSARGLAHKSASRPGAPRSRTRQSYEGARPSGTALAMEAKIAKRKRNMSFSARRLSADDDVFGGAGGRAGAGRSGSELEDEGDLGFAAASLRDHASMRRRVIVERLETVKSKGPFFTWC